MTDGFARGTLEDCLAKGGRAACLLKRFQAVVSDEEMAQVRYWFEDLYRKADEYLRQGYELVSVGFDKRQEWSAGPFMVFNPIRWRGGRRLLLAPTAESNPRQWVTIRIRSLMKPLRVFEAPALHLSSAAAARRTSRPAPARSVVATANSKARQPALQD